MNFSIIASGSKGNMTYIETNETKILLDAGISFREATRRIDFTLENIDAILITHEHIDHVKYLFALAKRFNATIYIQKASLDVLVSKEKSDINGLKVKYLESNVRYTIKDLSFLTLRLSHDSVGCLGFLFNHQNRQLGYISDTGFLPIPYVELLKSTDALIIESNHDIEMLHECDRPWSLKERILSVYGHMSNLICGQIINSIVTAKRLQLVILAHVSEDCNTEEVAIDTVMESIEGEHIPNIIVAKQREATKLIEV